jgi:RNA polymerase sigma factor (sigma-70 family)
VGTREDWDEIAARLRGSSAPDRSPYVRALYELAIRDGTGFLAAYRRSLDEDRVRDLIHDVLATKLKAILDAETPRAFFCTVLQNRARSWLRRGDAKVVETLPDSARERSSGVSEEERRVFHLDAEDALSELSERDRAIVVAASFGEDRETIAREHGTSRANVDQIVSRTQKRFRERS